MHTLRLIILFCLLGISLLAIFRAPTSWLWYLSIAVTEFPWIFMGLVGLVMLWPPGGRQQVAALVMGVAALGFYAWPVFSAWRIAAGLNKELQQAFQPASATGAEEQPFRITQMVAGIGAREVPFKTFKYNSDVANPLVLDFYASEKTGPRPCVVVVHGGSWAGGNSRQLPELNSYLAKSGYHVAAINYRLAPRHTFPAPVDDVKEAMLFLKRKAGHLQIDTAQFVLLGRSAGAQVALTAAYTLPQYTLKGIIAFYGPADMVWGYGFPANPLVMDSKGVMENYLGGTYSKVPQVYKNSSPIEAVGPQAPPTLLIHGMNDPLVAYEHSTRLSKKLTYFKVPHYLLTLPWATHGCDYTLNGPGGQLSTYTVSRFLQSVTK